ncbi:MAG: hypothetical protein WBV53_07680 [Solirubrobacterales bacterium]
MPSAIVTSLIVVRVCREAELKDATAEVRVEGRASGVSIDRQTAVEADQLAECQGHRPWDGDIDRVALGVLVRLLQGGAERAVTSAAVAGAVKCPAEVGIVSVGEAVHVEHRGGGVARAGRGGARP